MELQERWSPKPLFQMCFTSHTSSSLPPHPLAPFTAFLPLSASEDPRGKRWLSPYLINDPSESCPAALGLHVSRRVRKSGPKAFVLGGNGVSGPLCC